MNAESVQAVDEQRNSPRKPCLISVECGIRDRVFTNHIQNISYDGVFLETDSEFAVGQEISIRILAPHKLSRIKNITGEIVRVAADGVAVLFSKGDPVQEALIRAFVENI
jgi:hypothetical protein